MERHTALCGLRLYWATCITCDVDTSRQTPVSPHRTSSPTSLRQLRPRQALSALAPRRFESHPILAHPQTQGMLLRSIVPHQDLSRAPRLPHDIVPDLRCPAAFAPRSPPPLLLSSPSPYKTVPPAPATSLSSRLSKCPN
ncbi:hypothetical protein K438DRAFT_1967955 [Mycena galopus ATCC 62051]|nr:hypothetical protein K438DRAFT_1967955 [Mycena galopus ATCC 62051]